MLAALATAAGAAACLPGAAVADGGCNRVASPSGSDSAAGTEAAPFRSAARLAAALQPGETGCLRAGTYDEDLRVPRGGSAGAPITFRSFPGERAKLLGRLWVPDSADHVKFAGLELDGTNDTGLPSPTVNGDHTVWEDNEVTNGHTAICFVLGHGAYGRARHTLIQRNRIHNCGKLPATNHDHGIYVSEADDTTILGNVIYDNADRGIQMYPNAQRTTIRGNVIDGNGQGVLFSGDGGSTSNETILEFNVITNSKLRNNVESWYPEGNPVGRGNVVRRNCISGGVRDDGDGGMADEWGFSASDNLLVDPKYANRGGKDFTVPAGSPCAALLAGGAPPAAADPGRAQADPSRGTTPEPSAGGPKLTRPVHFRGLAHRGGRLKLRGKIQTRRGLRAAAASGGRAVIQLRWNGAWFPLATAKVVGGRFSSNVKLPPYLRNRTIKLRAVVPSVGTSETVRVRVG